MGRRRSLFSKSSMKAYAGMSPSAKIGVGIFILIIGGITAGITGCLYSGTQLIWLSVALAIIFGFFGIVSIFIGIVTRSDTSDPDEDLYSEEETISEKPGIENYHDDGYSKYNEYCNWYSSESVKAQERVLAAYAEQDLDKTRKEIERFENLEIKCDQNRIALHFFYLKIIDIIYAYRDIRDDAIPYCLELCDKDIRLTETIMESNPENAFMQLHSLTRKAIIYEKRKEYKKAIEVCDYGIAHHILDAGKSFEVRKAKILKKLGGKSEAPKSID